MSIQNLQNDSNYIILDNPFSNPKFVKQLSKTEEKLAKTDTYTLKLFAEIISQLNKSVLDNTTELNQIKIETNIKDFLIAINVEHTKGYNYVIEAADYLQTLKLKWTEKDGTHKSSVFVAVSEHNPKTGKINFYIPQQFAKRVLDVGMKENFSFLKQNLFKLDNNQAIKLYQFFKQWQNKGRYATDLVRFKEQFGYNTSGYNRFNKFETYVLEPATKEINDKTDIIVSYQTMGDNLDGVKPRVKGLIFYIKAKENPKQLPIGDHHQTAAPQPEATTTEPKTKPIERAKPQTTTDKPSEAEIFELGKLLKLNETEIQVVLQNFNYDYIEVWQRFKFTIGGIKDGTVKNKEKPLGFILSSPILGAGLWQTEKEKAQKRELERVEKEKQATIEKIQREYQERKTKQFTELYNKATDDTKQGFINDFKSQTKNGFNPYINQQNEIKPAGIYKIGEELAEIKGTGLEKRQAIFRNEIFEKYSYQIGYDQNDQVLILGLFENIEQSPATTEPQATAPHEPSQTAEQIQENKKRYQAQKRQPKPATAKTIEPQATEKTTPPPAIIQEPIKTEKPKTGIQKLFNFFN